MRKKHGFLVVALLLFLTSFSQETVDVTDQKIKVGGLKEEELYFGFAAGDKIIFNFQEIDKKELKEVEIIEYPGNSKFSDFKTKSIANKTLNVNQNSIYIFRFKNSAISGRICRIQIQRIPASESTKIFNTTVTWVTKQDTTWTTYTKDVIVGYDTTYEQRTKRELVKSEQTEEHIMSKSQRVHSATNSNSNKSYVFFQLPQNQISNYTTKKVISWAYWVGVGEEANSAWKENAKIISGLAKGIVGVYTSPLGALAVGQVTNLLLPQIGEDVTYALTDKTNTELFLQGNPYRPYDHGKGVAGYKSFTNPLLCQGTYYVCLHNDNIMTGINVEIKAIAIIETNVYEDKKYTETVVKTRYEKQLFKEPSISNNKIPVIPH